MSAHSTPKNPIDIIFQALWDRWAQLEMGRDAGPADEARAAELRQAIETAWGDHKAGTLDLAALERWAVQRVPWLHNALHPSPEPPRRAFVAPAVPAPTPAHAAVADKIVRGDVARRGVARYTGRGGDHE